MWWVICRGICFLVEKFSTPNTPTLYTCNSYIIASISNSKAAKGLLVYLEVNSICTAIPISLSQSSRQLLYRYIIHARPHLTARVFRYLRTLIGKAAVYRGFHPEPNLLIFKPIRYPADTGQTSHSIVRFILAECFVLIKQSYNTIPCFLFHRYLIPYENGPPYPEVTWVNLPSSLMIDYSNAFVFSTSLLVVVFRYGIMAKGNTSNLSKIAIALLKNHY